MRTEPRIISLLALTLAAFAQGRDPASNSSFPSTSSLSSMRDTCRPLLLFAPSVKDPGFVQQIDELRAHVSEIKERDILVIPVISSQPGRSNLPPDLPIAALTESEVTELTSRLNLNSDSFQLVLVGKDGRPKLSTTVPVSVHQLSRLIDSMPMRKLEIKQRSQQGKPSR